MIDDIRQPNQQNDRSRYFVYPPPTHTRRVLHGYLFIRMLLSQRRPNATNENRVQDQYKSRFYENRKNVNAIMQWEFHIYLRRLRRFFAYNIQYIVQQIEQVVLGLFLIK